MAGSYQNQQKGQGLETIRLGFPFSICIAQGKFYSFSKCQLKMGSLDPITTKAPIVEFYQVIHVLSEYQMEGLVHVHSMTGIKRTYP